MSVRPPSNLATSCIASGQPVNGGNWKNSDDSGKPIRSIAVMIEASAAAVAFTFQL